MKYMKLFIALMMCACTLSACGQETSVKVYEDAMNIVLSDNEITVDDVAIDGDSSKDVYKANDIVYYEEGHDFTYGEGSEKDAHSKQEADKHTVVHITESGTYSISGKLSFGQIAIDLGKDAKEDESAVVTLILNGVDINCDVAPAVIFYNVYECGSDDEAKASKDVDTSKAGANVIIADDTTNTISGAYVEKIYKADSVVLNSDKTAVEDAKKLHKYDAAFYSKMTMNVNGEDKNTGVLNINATNEGLDSELHLTINGGNINIVSGNDGINTNEDNISVTTLNGGVLNIRVSGETGEGDGIDSNGWLVINGGTLIAQACASSMDAGIDSDKGIHINGGTVIASGNMLDSIEEGGQTYAVFNFNSKLEANSKLTLKDSSNKEVMSYEVNNSASIVIFSSVSLKEGEYTLYSGDKQLSYSGNNVSMFPGGNFKPDGEMNMPDGAKPNNNFGNFNPGNFDINNLPDNFNASQFGDFDINNLPDNFNSNQFGNFDPNNMPDNFDAGQFGNMMPGNRPNQGQINNTTGETKTVFEIKSGSNMFSGIS